MKKTKRKIICFDLDGTLVISTPVWHESLMEIINLDEDLIQAEELRGYVGYTVSQILKEKFKDWEKDKIKDTVTKIRSKFLEKLEKVDLIEGALDVLNLLKEDYDLAVLSNDTEDEIFKILEAAGIDSGLFSFVVGSDDVENPKPSPDELLSIKFATDQDILCMVGDAETDIKSASAAGITAVLVNTGLISDEKARLIPFDFRIDSVNDLPSILNDIENQQGQ